MLRRAAAEDVNLSLPLDDLAVATNRLYRRSNLHNITPKKASSLLSASREASRASTERYARTPESMQIHTLRPVRPFLFRGKKIPQAKRSPAQGRQILHIFTGFTTPPPRQVGRFLRGLSQLRRSGQRPSRQAPGPAQNGDFSALQRRKGVRRPLRQYPPH